jgi:hypothetical protein
MSKNLLKSTIAFFIIFIATSTQSCKVYDKDAVPELEAVASAKKVKVITTNGKTYKFNKLVIDEDNLVGLTKPKSKEAKYLPSETFVDAEGRTMEKVSIDRETIKEINVFDKKKSKNKTIWLVAGLTVGIILFGAATGFVILSAV